MLRCVPERFLNDAEKSERRTTGQVAYALVGLASDRDAGRGAELLAVGVHRLG